MVSNDQLLADLATKQTVGHLANHATDVTVSQKMLREAAADKERVSEVLDREKLVCVVVSCSTVEFAALLSHPITISNDCTFGICVYTYFCDSFDRMPSWLTCPSMPISVLTVHAASRSLVTWFVIFVYILARNHSNVTNVGRHLQ